MQRNRAYSNRMKQLKVKTKRQRAKTIGTHKPSASEIFESVGSINCSSDPTECGAFQRIIYILKMYDDFLSEYIDSYYEQQSSSHSQPSTPTSPSSPYCPSPFKSPSTYTPKSTKSANSPQSPWGVNPFDIIKKSNLKPSKTIKKKKISLKKTSNSNNLNSFRRGRNKKDRVNRNRSKTPRGTGKGGQFPSTVAKQGGFYALYGKKCGEYNNIHLINDFNHLTEIHKFEDLVNETIKQLNDNNNKCKLSECISLNRMYRDRLKCCKNNKFRKQIFLGFYDSTEIITQQILDKIHNYMVHTFEIGIKLNIKEIETKSNDSDYEDEYDDDIDSKMSFGDAPSLTLSSSKSGKFSGNFRDEILININKIINKKREILRDLTGNRYLTKFTSIIDQNTHIANNFGANNGHYAPRYYYWSIYSDWDGTDKSNPGYDYADWHIQCKYSSLKHELLSGINNKFMTKTQWHDLIALCGIYRHCQRVKTIQADFDDLHGYGIKRYTPIQTQHLLSILIYCNFESIRKRFCQTYIRIPGQEEDDHLKERHSSFAHLARLIRESVEVFGERTLFSRVKKFYHCVDKELMFKATSGYFNMPTSTSINYETVINLNKKTGVILQLKDNNDTHINGGVRFFDCSWISDFCYEYEMLFISSLSPMHIETIIQCNLGHNYGYFIHSLNTIYSMMKGRRYKNVTNDGNDQIYKKCAFQLIQHQLFKNSVNHNKRQYVKYSNLPKYIENLLDYFFLNTLQVQINYEHLCDKNQFKLFDSLFVLNQKYVKLDAILTLFPNVRKINFNGIKGRLQFDDNIFATILKLLSSRNINKYLQEIVFKEALPNSMCQSLNKYQSKFIQSRWLITQEIATLIFKQSTFDVV